MKANANNDELKIKVNEFDIESSPQEKLLGVILDGQVNFQSHMSNLCKKVGQKMEYSCTYISSFIDFPKHRVIMKVYIN